MNKKGFTLTELIAILVIISIVALIAVPAVVNSIKNNNHDSYNGVVNDIILASETYAANMGASIVQVSVETLKQAGYLSPDLKNPIDNSDFNGCVYIVNGDPIYKEETCSTIIKNVDGVRLYKDSILNGLDPVLDKGLIPVTIGDDGTVTKASIATEWYNYGEKRWANAVILKGSDNYIEGQTIPENNIDAYFVWIPKFKYKLFDMGNYTTYSGTSKPDTSNAKTLDIVFDPVNTTDSDTSCMTPLTSGASGNCAVGKYMTHPSFITLGVNGYWVGKYETSGTTSDLDVKPNVSSLRSTTVGDFFTSMYNYNRDLDSHMMKNTEWGAVAYLSLSNYGINGEVRINNSSTYTTGCAATVANTTNVGVSQSDHSEGYYNGCENAYNTATGYLASTTGNITGVYDMSGGAREYLAGYISGAGGGFTPSSYNGKYYDVYDSNSSVNSYNYRILGDATGEMGPFYKYSDSDNNQRIHSNWFADGSDFIESSDSWFARGNNHYYGVVAGQAEFHKGAGTDSSTFSSRLVLAPGSTARETALGTTWTFDYTGNAQTFTVPEDGNYKIELWGAQGGALFDEANYGGYTSGILPLRNEKLYIYVGAQGNQVRNVTFNGGGYGGVTNGINNSGSGAAGGGATDIRLENGEWNNFSSLKSRIMVAAGGGGSASTALYSTAGQHSSAGGLIGYSGGYYSGHSYVMQEGQGASQITGGAAGVNHYSSTGTNYAGTFGIGGNSNSTSDNNGAGGGGGGYYGGGAGGGTAGGGGGQGGGGGSSFISGYFGCNAIAESSTASNITHTNQSNHYSGKVFTNGIMIDGAGCNWSTGSATNCGTNQPQPDGTMAVGHSGNGYAKITLMSY
nr:prepilin-type N-terminal cleavage/methylation domain-containing protein [Bacilli bacterium]